MKNDNKVYKLEIGIDRWIEVMHQNLQEAKEYWFDSQDMYTLEDQKYQYLIVHTGLSIYMYRQEKLGKMTKAAAEKLLGCTIED